MKGAYLKKKVTSKEYNILKNAEYLDLRLEVGGGELGDVIRFYKYT